MKEALAILGVLALAGSLWFLRGHTDNQTFDSKNETIRSLQESVQAKDQVISKNDAVLDSLNASIKQLKNEAQAKDDLLTKQKDLVDSANTMIKSLQDTVRDREDTISKNNELIQTLQAKWQQPPPPARESEEEPVVAMYPGDNGFEMQDAGSGFFSYLYFGETVRNPNHVQMPERRPNLTPWKFTGNAGIGANGSGIYVTGASNLDSTGHTSQNGQAAFLEYMGSTVSQSVKLPRGTFAVTFDYEARRDYTANRIEVSLDGKVLFSQAPSDCLHFKRVTTDPVTLETAGLHDLKFKALGDGDNTGYPCSFIDNVSFTLVRSPRTQMTLPNLGSAHSRVKSLPAPNE